MTTHNPAVVEPETTGPHHMADEHSKLTIDDLALVQKHICEPSHRGTMQEMKAGFDRIETKIDTLAENDSRKFGEVSYRQDKAEARQDKTDEEIKSLKKLAGIALFIYGLISVAVGGLVASAGAWLKAKLFG